MGSEMAPFERAMVVSYRLSIVTVALSLCLIAFDRTRLIGRNLRSNVSNAQINRGGSLSAKISGCSPWSRPLMFGSAESEHTRLTNGEII